MFRRKSVNQRQIDALQAEAAQQRAHGQYAQAAATFAQVAAAYLDENPLIYARCSRDAFEMHLKARQGPEAAQLAQQVLQVLDDTGWLKKSMEEVVNLKGMRDALATAGFAAEAAGLAQALNTKLAEFGLMLTPEHAAPSAGLCPNCGAPLPTVPAGQERRCTFCGYLAAG